MKKILLFFILLLLIPTNAHAVATYYAVNAGGNWSAGATWSTVSTKSAARVAGATQPTAADTCILDDYSGSVTVDTTTCVCLTASCTTNGNYAGILTFTSGQKLTVSGSFTLASTMTVSGTGNLTLNNTGTLTTGGKTISGDLSFTGTSKTYTFGDAITVTGTTTFGGSTATTITTNNFNLVSGPIVETISALSVTFGGTGTVSGTSMSLGASTLTIASNWTISGATTLSGGNSTLNGSTFNFNTAGLVEANRDINGSATIVLTGGTWSGGGTVSTPLTINSAGTVTTSGALTFTHATRVFTMAGGTLGGSGTLTFGTNGSTLAMTGGTITAEIDFTTATHVLNSNFTSTGIIAIIGTSPVFTGAFNLSCATLNAGPNSGTARSITFPASQTWTVTTALNLDASKMNAVSFTLKSGTASTAINLTYQGTLANEKIFNVIFTDVDASTSSNPIYNYCGGTLTRTTNIYNTDPSSFPTVDKVTSGTSYAGGALTGTASSGGSYTGFVSQ